MATAKQTLSRQRRIWPQVLLALVLVTGAAAWINREPIDGYTTTGTAFGARTACSCRYIAGRPLDDCEKDFEPGMEVVFLSDDPETKSVTARVPTRTNRDDRYFADTYQAMPLHGYTRMFERMLSHPNIKVMLATDYREVADLLPWRHMVYTGPIDAFFNHRYGKLPYRSLEFRHETLAQEQFQPVGTVNYPNDYGYTRISEFKHITGQRHHATSVVYEYPRADGDPYYPVPRSENTELYRRYEADAEKLSDVTFVGRLATYKYYNMDQVVGQSLTAFKKLRQRHEQGQWAVPLEGVERAGSGSLRGAAATVAAK